MKLNANKLLAAQLADAAIDALSDFIAECGLPSKLPQLRSKGPITPALLRQVADSTNLLAGGRAPSPTTRCTRFWWSACKHLLQDNRAPAELKRGGGGICGYMGISVAVTEKFQENQVVVLSVPNPAGEPIWMMKF